MPCASQLRCLLLAAIGLALAGAPAEARTVYVASAPGGCGGLGNTVTAFDTATGAVKPITGFASPAGLVVSPDGNRLYVANGASGTIGVVDTATNTVIGSVLVGGVPCAPSVSPDGSRVYAPNSSASVAVVDAATNTALPPIPAVGTNATSFSILPDGSKGYVTRDSGADSLVSVVKLPGGEFIKDINIGMVELPQDAAIKLDGSRLYTADGSSGAFSSTVIDTATDTEVAGSPIPVTGSPNAIVPSPDGARMYLATNGGATKTVDGIDIAANAQITTGGLPLTIAAGPRDIAMMPDGSSLFTVGVTDDKLYQVSTATNTILASPGPFTTGVTAVAVVPDQAPTAAFTATPAAPGGAAKFDASGSSDPDGQVVRWDWNFGDGTSAANGGPKPSHSYAKPGLYSVVLTVTDNEGGSTARVFTGQAMLRNGGPSATKTVNVDTLPAISALSVSNKRFAVAAAKRRVKRGTVFRYTLSEVATVKFAIDQKTSGRRVGKKCKRKTKTNAKRRKCTLYKSKGSLSAKGKAGKNSTRFSGKLKNKKLKRGSYRATAVATDPAKGKSAARTVSFSIVR